MCVYVKRRTRETFARGSETARRISADPRRRARVRTHRPLVIHAVRITSYAVFSFRTLSLHVLYHSKHLSLLRFTFSRAPRALVRAVSALRRRARRARRTRRVQRRVSPQPPQVLPSVVEGVSSPLQFPTQHLQPSLGRDIEHRRRFRSRARAGRGTRRDVPLSSVSPPGEKSTGLETCVFQPTRDGARTLASRVASGPSSRRTVSSKSRRTACTSSRRTTWPLHAAWMRAAPSRRSIVARTRRLHGERSGGGI